MRCLPRRPIGEANSLPCGETALGASFELTAVGRSICIDMAAEWEVEASDPMQRFAPRPATRRTWDSLHVVPAVVVALGVAAGNLVIRRDGDRIESFSATRTTGVAVGQRKLPVGTSNLPRD